jgi:hypothetical protein
LSGDWVSFWSVYFVIFPGDYNDGPGITYTLANSLKEGSEAIGVNSAVDLGSIVFVEQGGEGQRGIWVRVEAFREPR